DREQIVWVAADVELRERVVVALPADRACGRDVGEFVQVAGGGDLVQGGVGEPDRKAPAGAGGIGECRRGPQRGRGAGTTSDSPAWIASRSGEDCIARLRVGVGRHVRYFAAERTRAAGLGG